MQHKILVTGATGLVGATLVKRLKNMGHDVAILTRNPDRDREFEAYTWDIEKKEIDARCLSGVDTIVHLAGEPIADKPWTAKQKKQIIDSRAASAGLLFETLKNTPNTVRNFISAAAVGYYGDRADEKLTEESAPGIGFIAACCIAWEAAADQFKELDIRVVKIRVGIVLDKFEGSLPVMAKPIKLFTGAPLGPGDQWVPWIHKEDIVGIFLHAIFNPGTKGVYNGCAPNPVTNKQLTHAIAKAVHRPVWPVHIPKAVLGLILGERRVLPLMSTRTMSDKVEASGYPFKFTTVEAALEDIYKDHEEG